MMRPLLNLCAGVGLIFCAAGCAGKVHVIDAAVDVVRVGPGVTGPAFVWDQSAGGWVLVKRFKYPAGWFAGPMPAE